MKYKFQIFIGTIVLLCITNLLNAQIENQEQWRECSETDSISKIRLYYGVESNHQICIFVPTEFLNPKKENELIEPAIAPEEFFLAFNKNLKRNDFAIKHDFKDRVKIEFEVDSEGLMIVNSVKFIEKTLKDFEDETLRVLDLTKDIRWKPAYKIKPSGEKEKINFMIVGHVLFY